MQFVMVMAAEFCVAGDTYCLYSNHQAAPTTPLKNLLFPKNNNTFLHLDSQLNWCGRGLSMFTECEDEISHVTYT